MSSEATDEYGGPMWDQRTPCPDAPHPLAYRVDDTDGRPTWELYGSLSCGLDPAVWEAAVDPDASGPEWGLPGASALGYATVLVRRVAPPEPTLAEALAAYDAARDESWLAHSQNDPTRDALVAAVRKTLDGGDAEALS